MHPKTSLGGRGTRANGLIVIFTAIALDSVGIGLIFPILPGLLRQVTHSNNVAPFIGITVALYAFMQFIFAPVLGALSDRLGRRPVLLISLFGAAISYVLMASASSLWMLLAGRAIAGLTSANMAVATAYITDISPEDERAGRFGIFNAMFGIGFIIGPVLGGREKCCRLRKAITTSFPTKKGFIFWHLISIWNWHSTEPQCDFSNLPPNRRIRAQQPSQYFH